MQVLFRRENPMNISTRHHHVSRVDNHEPVLRKLGHPVLVAAAIIAVCAGASFAQSSIITTALPTEDAATRPRRLTEEVKKDSPPHTERRIFVRSTSLFVGRAVLEDKLFKRSEFKQLGFGITRDQSDADLILELRHDVFTMYVFTVVDAKTGVVLLSGKLSSLGGTVAGKVAKRFVKEMPAPAGP
jgi:hypothetical protein